MSDRYIRILNCHFFIQNAWQRPTLNLRIKVVMVIMPWHIIYHILGNVGRLWNLYYDSELVKARGKVVVDNEAIFKEIC